MRKQYSLSIKRQDEQEESSARANQFYQVGELESKAIEFFDAGNLDKALEFYKQVLAIHQKLDPESLDVAIYFNNIGCVYNNMGEFDLALSSYKQALAIHQKLDPHSLNFANILKDIGNVCYGIEDFASALSYYQQALTIFQENKPHGIDVADALENVGSAYYGIEDFTSALSYHQRALKIFQENESDSLNIATSFNNIASAYYRMGNPNLAIEYHKKDLEIMERIAPDSHDLAISLSNAGHVYTSIDEYVQALELFLRSYNILNRDLIPTHPDLIESAHNIAKSAYQIANNQRSDANTFNTNSDLALQYCDIIINNDPKYKFAYYLKGLILQSTDLTNSLELALQSFNQALSLDPNYGDAKIAKTEILSEIAEGKIRSGDLEGSQLIIAEIRNIASPQSHSSNYDEEYIQQKIAEMRANGIEGVKIDLPSTQYPNDREVNNKILEESQRLQQVIHYQRALIESQQDDLDGRVSDERIFAEVFGGVFGMAIGRVVGSDIGRSIGSSFEEIVGEFIENNGPSPSTQPRPRAIQGQDRQPISQEQDRPSLRRSRRSCLPGCAVM